MPDVSHLQNPADPVAFQLSPSANRQPTVRSATGPGRTLRVVEDRSRSRYHTQKRTPKHHPSARLKPMRFLRAVIHNKQNEENQMSAHLRFGAVAVACLMLASCNGGGGGD